MSAGEWADRPKIVAAGDSALVLRLPPRIDPDINSRATAIATALHDRWHAVLRDVVVGYATVTVFFDPLRVDASWLESEIGAAAAMHVEVPPRPGQVFEVPVCYGSELGPDLAEVAAFASISEADVAVRHAAVHYRVYMMGFVPGFAYLAEVDPSIAAPRRATPRQSVAAGSVAIAGGQTAIYPIASPGGWNIIGRTALRPFDARRPEPSLFRAGDSVRFVGISREAYDAAS